MLISELLREGRKKLEEAGIEGCELESMVLLGHCLNLNRTEIYLKASEEVDEACRIRFHGYIDRRAGHEPVAYIMGEREFWSLDFLVNEHVLIPRPETEFLLEVVLRQVNQIPYRISRSVDLCCGSGAIAVVLARELNTKVLAIDCSAEALRVTRHNSKKHHVDDQVATLCSDLFKAVECTPGFPLIVSNPPYVSRVAITEQLDPEVADFEPRLALDGGADGLDCIRRIAMDVASYLAPSGMFFMEFGAEQGEEVMNIFSALHSDGRFFEKVDILKDYSGRDRVLAAQINMYT